MVIIAQLVERRSVKAEVVGAEPTGHPRNFPTKTTDFSVVFVGKFQCPECSEGQFA